MADQNQTEENAAQSGASQNELADELRELGDHIKSFLHVLWESQERKRVQQEVESGLANLGASINQAAREFEQSPTGQQVKQEFEEISNRVRSGEMETTLRHEVMAALKTANLELGKILNKMSASEKDQADSEPESKT